MSVAGSCLCGTVKWRATGDLTPLSHCHCAMCRKAHGAPFATFTSCTTVAFEWLEGVENTRLFKSSGELERRFCKTCGSAVPGGVPNYDRVFIPAASFDEDPALRGGRHVFTASKAPWHRIADDLEQHAEYPSSSIHDGLPSIDRDPLPDNPSGMLRGSCLCGACQFEVTASFAEVHNCHCTRCRKARAAAHTTNGFVPADGVRWIKGRDEVEVFRLPGAKRFSHAFCRTCGSGMPRTDLTEGFVGIPFGALDDEPDVGPMDHIYMSSRAPWYDPIDDLPKFDADPE